MVCFPNADLLSVGGSSLLSVCLLVLWISRSRFLLRVGLGVFLHCLGVDVCPGEGRLWEDVWVCVWRVLPGSAS